MENVPLSTDGSVTQLMREGLAPGADEDAYWRLYTRFVVQNESLKQRIARLLPNNRQSEPIDIVADAFSKVWDKAKEGKHDEFEDRDNLVGLLTAYAKAKVGDIRRRRRALGENSAFSVDGPHRLGEQTPRTEQPTEAELRSALEGIEERLACLESDEYREIVRLTFSGKTQTEIAEQLGLSNVKRIERALEAVRQQWMAGPIDAFREAWSKSNGEPSRIPDLIQHFNGFLHGGRWFLRDLIEIDIHARLEKDLPISLVEISNRLQPAQHPIVRRTFDKHLFFDEQPDTACTERLMAQLDDWTRQVVMLKMDGRTNRDIASSCSCSNSAVVEGLKKAREDLALLTSELDAR